jgi:ABC-type branched-subunit amino acid transport system substrate-binding protein
MKKKFFARLFIVFVGVLVLLSFSTLSYAKELKIGVTLGLTGPGSQMQILQKRVVQLCEDWINSKGGVTIGGENYQVQCIFEDTKSNTADSATAATKLIFKDGVKFIIGGAIPDFISAIASVTEKNKVLYVSGQIDRLHPDRPLSFVSNYSYVSPIPGLYETMLQLFPNVKTMGFIIEDETGARAIGGISQDIAKSKGLTLLEPLIHPWETKEYLPQWTKLLSMKPDAVDIGIKMPDNSASCVKQGRQLGFKGPMLATTSLDPKLALNMIGKDYATDLIWPAFDVNIPNAPEMTKEIVKLWYNSNKDPIDSDGINMWDNLWVLIQAISKAQSLDPVKVAKTWENMPTVETSRGIAKMGGLKTFGINHMVFRPCPMSRMKDGQVEFVRWFDPWAP